MTPEDSIEYFDQVVDMVKPFNPDTDFDPTEMERLFCEGKQIFDDQYNNMGNMENLQRLLNNWEDLYNEWRKRK